MNEKVKEVFVLMFFGSAVGAWAGYFSAAATAHNDAIQQERRPLRAPRRASLSGGRCHQPATVKLKCSPNLKSFTDAAF
jgi:hypothetical protein